MNDEDNGPQPDNVTSRRGALTYALWHRPLSAWFAAALLLAQTAVETAVQTAGLLLATATLMWQTLTWRGQRKCGGG